MQTKSTECLNCGAELKSNFCEECGQKSSTKRFSLAQLITSDFLSGFFDLEKGFLFTLKSLFTRPGHFVREYVQGKRKVYFHFLTFLLIILGINIFASEFSTIGLTDLVGESAKTKKAMQLIEDFSEQNPRLVILLQIPVYAFMSFLWFLKAQQNLAEHIILNTFKASGEIIIATIFIIVTIFYTNISVLFYVYNIFIYGLTLLFIAILYYQYFRPYYKNTLKFVLRVLCCIITAQFLVGILLGILGFTQAFIDGNFEEVIKSSSLKQ